MAHDIFYLLFLKGFLALVTNKSYGHMIPVIAFRRRLVRGQVPVIIGGQSMQISDGESHKLVGRVQFFLNGFVQCRVASRRSKFKRCCQSLRSVSRRLWIKI